MLGLTFRSFGCVDCLIFYALGLDTGNTLLYECDWKSEPVASNAGETTCSSAGEIEVCDVYHLPIIKAFADRIDLVNIINRLVPSKMEIDPGTLVLAMVLDALSGRHPLYRIDSFYANKDIELLLGQPLDVEKLGDDNFGRMLDLLYEANTTHLFSAIAENALRNFEVPTQHIHFDTTSVTVYGAYNPRMPDNPSHHQDHQRIQQGSPARSQPVSHLAALYGRKCPHFLQTRRRQCLGQEAQ